MSFGQLNITILLTLSSIRMDLSLVLGCAMLQCLLILRLIPQRPQSAVCVPVDLFRHQHRADHALISVRRLIRSIDAGLCPRISGSILASAGGALAARSLSRFFFADTLRKSGTTERSSCSMSSRPHLYLRGAGHDGVCPFVAVQGLLRDFGQLNCDRTRLALQAR